MTGQIEMLLHLARSQASGARETVAVAECVSNAIQPLLADIAAKGLAFENAVPVQATLTLNRQALDIVLTNLLRNAVMYTQRGHIRVSLGDGCLTVADSGIGIPAAQLPHIFGRFHRGNAHGEGFGIGLAIVKRICDQHGWHIEAESVPARGTTFRLRLS
jgi:signal transduction histidine kinase